MRRHFFSITLTAALALSAFPAAAKPPRAPAAKQTSTSAKADVLTVALLDTPDENYGTDVVVIGVPGKHVVGSLLVLAAGRPQVLFHQPSETAQLPFHKFGKQDVTQSNVHTLEIMLSVDAKHDRTVLLACPADQCGLFADVAAVEEARAHAQAEADAQEAEVEAHADPANLTKAKAMVDKMADLLNQMVADVEAAGNDTAKIKDIGEAFKKNGESMKIEGEALQRVLTNGQKKALDTYGREKIGPLMGKLMAAMMKAQAGQTP